ncbi:hypothetical protein [Tautonia plasticadhaerens]|uniref:Uncharacterized protein n=1 Tax=Tautonia plasticadhaerens TaxID=2527974 RepID=A0A518H1J4_9BACT|nr:hypothetical protein [Tautonia plasticadhaerens]QDV34707.1 hypothetical protein ElP_26010 [Tautonia plasticadhaerens]
MRRVETISFTLFMAIFGCNGDDGSYILGRRYALVENERLWVDGETSTAGELLDESLRRATETTPDGTSTGALIGLVTSKGLGTGSVVRLLGEEETPDGHPVVKVSVERATKIGTARPIDLGFLDAAEGMVGVIEARNFKAVEAE